MFKSAVLTLIVFLTCLNVSPAFAQSSDSKVDMNISGEIHRGVMYYDDGDNPDFRHVDNDNDPTLFRFAGVTTQPIAGWFLGGLSEFEFADNTSAKVTQADDPSTDTDSFKIRKAELFFSSPKYGVLSFGRGNTASENTSESDISGTFSASHASVQKVGGGLFFANQAGGLSVVQINQVFNTLDGLDRQARIRYDTPNFAGLVLSVSSSDHDQHDLAIRYQEDLKGFKVKAPASYTNTASNATLVDNQISGSVSVLLDSGINLTLSSGIQNTKGADAGRDPSFIYGKLGYQTQLNDLGFTAFSVDYGQYDEMRVVNEDGKTWGIQVLQKIAAWNTDIYITFRNFKLNNVAIGVKSLITGGVSIPDGSYIAPGSVITKQSQADALPHSASAVLMRKPIRRWSMSTPV